MAEFKYQLGNPLGNAINAAKAGFENLKNNFSSNEAPVFNMPLNSGYIEQLASMAPNSEAWYEKYLDALANESYYSRAVEYDKFVRSNYYQMMVQDLKKAGLNPYLALNSLGGSSGSNIQGSSSGYGAVSAAASSKKADAAMLRVLTSLLGDIFSSSGQVAKIIAAV